MGYTNRYVAGTLLHVTHYLEYISYEFQALKHLHDKNFVHFDLKPDNIMISKEGVYKLGDFGLLVNLIEVCYSLINTQFCFSIINEFQHKAKESKSYTSSDGDSKYLAREVLEGSISTAADIFSLGITMLELATDLVLPSNGPLWHQMRNGILPEEYTKGSYNTFRFDEIY